MKRMQHSSSGVNICKTTEVVDSCQLKTNKDHPCIESLYIKGTEVGSCPLFLSAQWGKYQHCLLTTMTRHKKQTNTKEKKNQNIFQFWNYFTNKAIIIKYSHCRYHIFKSHTHKTKKTRCCLLIWHHAI